MAASSLAGPKPWPLNPIKDAGGLFPAPKPSALGSSAFTSSALGSPAVGSSTLSPQVLSPQAHPEYFQHPQHLHDPQLVNSSAPQHPSPPSHSGGGSTGTPEQGASESEVGLVAQQMRQNHSNIAGASTLSIPGLSSMDASGAREARSPALSIQPPPEVSALDKYSRRASPQGSPTRSQPVGTTALQEPVSPTTPVGPSGCWPWAKKKNLRSQACHQCNAAMQVAVESRSELQLILERLGAVEQGLGRLEQSVGGQGGESNRLQKVEVAVSAADSRLSGIQGAISRLETSIRDWGVPSTLITSAVEQSIQKWREAEQERRGLKLPTSERLAQTSPKPMAQETFGKPPQSQSIRMLKLQASSPRRLQPSDSKLEPQLAGDSASRQSTPRVVKYDVCRHCGYRGTQQRVQQRGGHHNQGCTLAMVPEPIMRGGQGGREEATFGVFGDQANQDIGTNAMDLVAKSSPGAQLATVSGAEVHADIPGLQADVVRGDMETSSTLEQTPDPKPANPKPTLAVHPRPQNSNHPNPQGTPDAKPPNPNTLSTGKRPSPVPADYSESPGSIRQLGEVSVSLASAASPHKPLDMESHTPLAPSRVNQGVLGTDVVCPPPVATPATEKIDFVSAEPVPPTAEKSRLGAAQVTPLGPSSTGNVPLSQAKHTDITSPDKPPLMGLFTEEEMQEALTMANAPDPPADFHGYQFVNAGYGDENSNPRNHTPPFEQGYMLPSVAAYPHLQEPLPQKDYNLQILPDAGRYNFQAQTMQQHYMNSLHPAAHPAASQYVQPSWAGHNQMPFQTSSTTYEPRAQPADLSTSAQFMNYRHPSRAEELLGPRNGYPSASSGQYAM